MANEFVRVIGGTAIAAVLFTLFEKGCSRYELNHPYEQWKYKNAHYSIATDNEKTTAYTIVTKDGTKLRCYDFKSDNNINYVLVFNKEGKLARSYRPEENEEFVKGLMNKIIEARKYLENMKKEDLAKRTLFKEKEKQEEKQDLLDKIME